MSDSSTMVTNLPLQIVESANRESYPFWISQVPETAWDDEKAVPKINELAWELVISQAISSLPAPRKRDDRTIPEAIPLERLNLARAGIKHLSSLIQQLVELRNDEENDEYGSLRANKHAFDAACDLLTDAAIESAPHGRQIPYGCVSTDSEGGIRIEWVRETASVHLIIPASAERDGYVYHEEGTQYGTEPATTESLARWLCIITE